MTANVSDTPSSQTIDENSHLCFLPAYEKWQAGELTWQQYLHHALLHWTGLRHSFDNQRWPFTRPLPDVHPVGFALWKWQDKATGVKDVADLEAVFEAYEANDVASVQTKLAALTKETSTYLKRVLILLALQQRKLAILELCLQSEDGVVDAWPPNRPFEDTANGIDKNAEPELYTILESSEWRRRSPWHQPGRRDSRGA